MQFTVCSVQDTQRADSVSIDFEKHPVEMWSIAEQQLPQIQSEFLRFAGFGKSAGVIPQLANSPTQL